MIGTPEKYTPPARTRTFRFFIISSLSILILSLFTSTAVALIYTEQWNLTISDYPYAMKMSRDGNYIVVQNGTESVWWDRSGGYTSLYDHNGEEKWTKPYAMGSFGASSMDINSDGSRMILTRYEDNYELTTTVFSVSGNEIWSIDWTDHEGHAYATIAEDTNEGGDIYYGTAREDTGINFYDSEGSIISHVPPDGSSEYMYYNLDGAVASDGTVFIITNGCWGWWGLSRTEVVVEGGGFNNIWNLEWFPDDTDHRPRVSTDGTKFAVGGDYSGLYSTVNGTLIQSLALSLEVPGINEDGSLIIGRSGSTVYLYNSEGDVEWSAPGTWADISDDGNFIAVINGTKLEFYQSEDYVPPYPTLSDLENTFISTTELGFEWTQSDNTEFVSIYRGSTSNIIDQTFDTYWTDSNLIPGEEYTYHFKPFSATEEGIFYNITETTDVLTSVIVVPPPNHIPTQVPTQVPTPENYEELTIFEEILDFLSEVITFEEVLVFASAALSWTFILTAYLGAFIAYLVLMKEAEDIIDVLLYGTVGLAIPLLINFSGIFPIINESFWLNAVLFGVFGFVTYAIINIFKE